MVLHRVGPAAQGPIDSVRTDARGGFRFSYRADSATFYLASSRYAGIEYFSPPLPTNPAHRDTSIRIVVYDTSSTASVELEARHLVVTRPGEDGSRGVLDLIMLRNPGPLTRIAPDSVGSSWVIPLPARTVGLQVGESDLSAEAVSRRGDSLFIGAAIAPGEKQLTVQYQLPSGIRVLQLPLTADSATVNVLIEEPGASVIGAGLQQADSQVIQGRSFHRWTGVPRGTALLRIVLPGIAEAARWTLPVLVGLLGLGLLATGWLALSRRQEQPVAGRQRQLVEAIASLDFRYQGKQAQTPEAEWQLYLAERARLKRELQTTLAAGEPSR